MINGKFILASNSPRRREMLHLLGLDFDVIPANIREEIGDNSFEPGIDVSKVALAKAKHIAASYTTDIILAADTIVTIQNRNDNLWSIFGKPKDRQDAYDILVHLSDNEHSVFTGYAIVNESSNFYLSQVVETKVRFRKLNAQILESYLNSLEWQDKAGAYSIQESSSPMLIDSINGSYTNIVGLPLTEVIRDLANITQHLPSTPESYRINKP